MNELHEKDAIDLVRFRLFMPETERAEQEDWQSQ